MNYEERHAQAKAIYAAGLEKVATTPPPAGQKFAPGTKVKLKSGAIATVLYTYAHAYWGDDVKSYCLDFEGRGSVSWFDESQLTEVE